MQKANRQAIIWAGAPRVGKSTRMNIWAKQYHTAGMGNVVIYDVNGTDKAWQDVKLIDLKELPKLHRYQTKEIVRVFDTDGEKVLREMAKLRGALCVLDDCYKYVNVNAQKCYTDLLMCREHLYLDIFTVFHALTIVPPKTYMFSSGIVQFKTTENPKKILNMDKIPFSDKLVRNYYELQRAEKYTFKQLQFI